MSYGEQQMGLEELGVEASCQYRVEEMQMEEEYKTNEMDEIKEQEIEWD